MTHIAVLGGGIAGLAAARRLALAGAQVTLFEASDRLGGMIQPGTIDNLTFDIGAEAFAVRGGSVAALAAELGLGDDLVAPRTLGSWAHAAAGGYRLPAGGLVGIPSAHESDAVDPALEAAIGAEGVASVHAEAALDPAIGADAGSLAELIRARYGDTVLERLVAPVVRGVYSLDPDVVDHRVLVPQLARRLGQHGSLGAAVASLRAAAPAGALVNTVRGGMHRLVAALVAETARLGVEVRLGESMHVDDARLARFNGTLVTVGSALGDTAEPISAEVVAMLVDAPELDAHPRGTGLLVADAREVEAKALTHATAKWPWLAEAAGAGRHLLRLSYGAGPGASAARTLELSDGELRTRALADATTLLGTPLPERQVVGLARQHWRIPAPSARLGRPAELAALRERIANTPRLEAAGTWIDGTGLALVIPAVDRAVERLLAAKVS